MASSSDHRDRITIESPPRSITGILSRLGPGLIIAGAIVGSGELIATTKVGAESGFWLLWLIILGCVIKVFVQVEFGRFTVAHGLTTMDGMNSVPGPRYKVSWLLWCWLAMFVLLIAQLGGIVGGVGQAVAMSVPLTGDVAEQMQEQSALEAYNRQVAARIKELRGVDAEGIPNEIPADELSGLTTQAKTEAGEAPQVSVAYTWDDVLWSGILTVITSFLLVNGRYGVIQTLSTVFVAGFTALTLVSIIGIQADERWAISWDELKSGLMFKLPPVSTDGTSPLFTALAAFGIIGVGASELISYPYWCLEKGYARFTGPRDASPEWAERARGWLRVMRWDAWCSMGIYTTATVVFYLLGASVLHREGLNPAGLQMIRTLETMYSQNQFFGTWGSQVFLLGAFAVLYSTFFVATAGNARMAGDGIRIFGFSAGAPEKRLWWVRFFSALFPFLSLGVYTLSKSPVKLVLLSGLAQAMMLPLLGFAALVFRYRECDVRIRPTKLWDIFLWVSVLGLLVTGAYGGWGKLMDLYHMLVKLLG